MGVDSYLVASTVNIAIAQRLVRKICGGCRAGEVVSEALAKALQRVPLVSPFTVGETLYSGSGCEACDNTGYAGRVCINEVLVADDPIREAILRKAPASEIRKIAIKGGMTTMLEDGFNKVRAGVTTAQEVLRVVHE